MSIPVIAQARAEVGAVTVAIPDHLVAGAEFRARLETAEIARRAGRAAEAVAGYRRILLGGGTSDGLRRRTGGLGIREYCRRTLARMVRTLRETGGAAPAPPIPVQREVLRTARLLDSPVLFEWLASDRLGDPMTLVARAALVEQHFRAGRFGLAARRLLELAERLPSTDEALPGVFGRLATALSRVGDRLGVTRLRSRLEPAQRSAKIHSGAGAITLGDHIDGLLAATDRGSIVRHGWSGIGGLPSRAGTASRLEGFGAVKLALRNLHSKCNLVVAARPGSSPLVVYCLKRGRILFYELRSNRRLEDGLALGHTTRQSLHLSYGDGVLAVHSGSGNSKPGRSDQLRCFDLRTRARLPALEPQRRGSKVLLVGRSPVLADGMMFRTEWRIHEAHASLFVAGLHLSSGRRAWAPVLLRRLTMDKRTRIGRPSSLAVSEGRVFVCNGEGLVVCLDAASGRLVWATPYARGKKATQIARRASVGPPIVTGAVVYVAPPDHLRVLGLDADTGRLLGRGISRQNVVRVLATGDGSVALVGRREITFFKRDRSLGKVLLARNTGKVADATVAGGVVLVPSKKGLLRVRVKSQTRLETLPWSKRRQGQRCGESRPDPRRRGSNRDQRQRQPDHDGERGPLNWNCRNRRPTGNGNGICHSPAIDIVLSMHLWVPQVLKPKPTDSDGS